MSARRTVSSPKRSRYKPPSENDVVETSLGALIQGRRSLRGDQKRDQTFDSTFARKERPIWCAGSIDLLQRPCVAVVGTREVSDDGKARARRLAKELVAAGVVVVSGLAKGVDTVALTSAIEAGGSVVGVIGTPLDQAFPIENAALQEQIAARHLLLSHFAPRSKTSPGHFPERNRLMAAVSDATAIIEAGDTSGTLHQAAECVKLGRWLFVAKNVMEDASLEWPAKFKDYPNVRTLTQTSDILDVLKS